MSTIRLERLENPNTSNGGIDIDSAGNVNIDSNTLYVDAGNNRVGIGTASPSTTLDIGGAVNGASFVTNPQLGIAGDVFFEPGFGNDVQIFNYRATAMAFGVSGVEKARIDSSGRLLVGTSSPRSNLYNASYTPTFQFETNQSAGLAARSVSVSYNNNGDTGGAIINLITSRGNTSGANNLVANNDELGSISFLGTDGTRPITGAAIAAYVDGTPGNLDMPGRLVFFTTADGASSPTERMRIHYNGTILFNATSASQTSDTGVKFFGAGNEGFISQVFSTTDGGATTLVGYSTGDSSYKYYFKGNGGLANYSANNTNLSDEREKKNVENLGSTWECLKHWELKEFHYNEDNDAEPKKYGVIAQQVEPFCPEVVADWKKGEDEDGNPVMRLAVKEQQMMWMAIKALQEAQLRIETLEAEVAALKAS